MIRLTTIFGQSRDQDRKCLKTQRVNSVVLIFFNATVWKHSNTKSVAWTLKETAIKARWHTRTPTRCGQHITHAHNHFTRSISSLLACVHLAFIAVFKRNYFKKHYDVIRSFFDTLYKISVPFFVQIEIPCYIYEKRWDVSHPFKKPPLTFVSWGLLPVFHLNAWQRTGTSCACAFWLKRWQISIEKVTS